MDEYGSCISCSELLGLDYEHSHCSHCGSLVQDEDWFGDSDDE